MLKLLLLLRMLKFWCVANVEIVVVVVCDGICMTVTICQSQTQKSNEEKR